MTVGATGAPEPAVAWHSLTPADTLERQGVTLADGLTSAEADARRARYGPNKFAEAAKEPRWQAFAAPVQGPDADRPAGGGHPQPVPPGPVRRPASC